MSIVDIHARLGNSALYYTLLMALWGLWRYFRKQGVDSSYWGALAIAEILYLIQGGLGLFMWLSGSSVLPGAVHVLYGVVSVLVIPSVYLYTRGDEQRRVMLIYGVALLFAVGIVLRAIFTGREG